MLMLLGSHNQNSLLMKSDADSWHALNAVEGRQEVVNTRCAAFAPSAYCALSPGLGSALK